MVYSSPFPFPNTKRLTLNCKGMGRGPETICTLYKQLQLARGRGWFQFMKQKTFRTCLQPHSQTAGGQEEGKLYPHTTTQGKSLNLFEPQPSYLKTEQIIYPDNHTGGGKSSLTRQQMGKRFVNSEALWSEFTIIFFL